MLQAPTSNRVQYQQVVKLWFSGIKLMKKVQQNIIIGLCKYLQMSYLRTTCHVRIKLEKGRERDAHNRTNADEQGLKAQSHGGGLEVLAQENLNSVCVYIRFSASGKHPYLFAKFGNNCWSSKRGGGGVRRVGSTWISTCQPFPYMLSCTGCGSRFSLTWGIFVSSQVTFSAWL